MFLVCMLWNNTIISPCGYSVRNLQLLFDFGENDPLFQKMVYNLVAFLLLHAELVHVTTVEVDMFCEITENTMLANTELLSVEKVQG